MKLQVLMCTVGLWLCCSGCGDSNLTSITPEEINGILSHVDEESPRFVEKSIKFDSILTLAGVRQSNDTSERVKIKLFYYNDLVRGYYNLIDKDDKNLQVFGKKVKNRWVLKCVTKLNMTEVGGYMILESGGASIWSNGDLNFKPQEITLLKADRDYDVLKTW